MKALFCVCILLQLLIFCGMCSADAERSVEDILYELDISQVQQYANSLNAPFSVQEKALALISGESNTDIAEFIRNIPAYLLQAIKGAMGTFTGMISAAIISAAITQFIGNGKGAELACYVCRLSCAVTLSIAILGKIQEVSVLIGNIAGFANAVFPLLTTLLAAAGGDSAIAMLKPAAAFAAGFISQTAAEWGVRLCSVAAGLAVAGNLNTKLPLKKLFSFVRAVLNYSAGGVISLFMLFLSVHGAMSQAIDGMALRAARYAVDNTVPVIGANVADAMDSLVGSALLVKNALGIIGISVIAIMCMKPIVELIGMCFGLRFAASLMEPVADEKLVLMTEQFSKVMEMLIVVCVSSAFMLIILLGTTVRAGSNFFQ